MTSSPWARVGLAAALLGMSPLGCGDIGDKQVRPVGSPATRDPGQLMARTMDLAYQRHVRTSAVLANTLTAPIKRTHALHQVSVELRPRVRPLLDDLVATVDLAAGEDTSEPTRKSGALLAMEYALRVQSLGSLEDQLEFRKAALRWNAAPPIGSLAVMGLSMVDERWSEARARAQEALTWSQISPRSGSGGGTSNDRRSLRVPVIAGLLEVAEHEGDVATSAALLESALQLMGDAVFMKSLDSRSRDELHLGAARELRRSCLALAGRVGECYGTGFHEWLQLHPPYLLLRKTYKQMCNEWGRELPDRALLYREAQRVQRAFLTLSESVLTHPGSDDSTRMNPNLICFAMAGFCVGPGARLGVGQTAIQSWLDRMGQQHPGRWLIHWIRAYLLEALRETTGRTRLARIALELFEQEYPDPQGKSPLGVRDAWLVLQGGLAESLRRDGDHARAGPINAMICSLRPVGPVPPSWSQVWHGDLREMARGSCVVDDPSPQKR